MKGRGSLQAREIDLGEGQVESGGCRRPSQCKRSPAPLVHAASRRVRLELREAYYTVVAAFREAAEKLRSGCRDVAFPEGCFPPSLPFCRSG